MGFPRTDGLGATDAAGRFTSKGALGLDSGVRRNDGRGWADGAVGEFPLWFDGLTTNGKGSRSERTGRFATYAVIGERVPVRTELVQRRG